MPVKGNPTTIRERGQKKHVTARDMKQLEKRIAALEAALPAARAELAVLKGELEEENRG